jgi:3-methyladenine DNA glycosylase AlkD
VAAYAATEDRSGRGGSSVKEVDESLAWLERKGTQRNRDGMAHFGIVANQAFGVSMESIHILSKKLGRDHELALALWDTEWYEARLLAAFVDEPARVTPAQMNRWARDFDNWGICDTLCFKLFDKTPHAWSRIDQWSKRREEFVKRAAFALLASVALHDKEAANEPFTKSFALIERESTDDRNFVKKGVSWALRSVGHRNAVLNREATRVAKRLAASDDATARWIGKDALKDITRPSIIARVNRDS